MHKLNDKEIYSLDIISFSTYGERESFYRLTYRYEGKLYCNLFASDTDAREFIDRYYMKWWSAATKLDTPPAENLN